MTTEATQVTQATVAPARPLLEVADIDVVALGARIMTRIQTSLLLEAAIRVDVATTLP